MSKGSPSSACRLLGKAATHPNGPSMPARSRREGVSRQGGDARGMRVIIDLHNYGRYSTNIDDAGSGNGAVIGSHAVPRCFEDLWTKLATALQRTPRACAVRPDNEPTQDSRRSGQGRAGGSHAIRPSHEDNHYVEGDVWASAYDWQGQCRSPSNRVGFVDQVVGGSAIHRLGIVLWHRRPRQHLPPRSMVVSCRRSGWRLTAACALGPDRRTSHVVGSFIRRPGKAAVSLQCCRKFGPRSFEGNDGEACDPIRLRCRPCISIFVLVAAIIV